MMMGVAVEQKQQQQITPSWWGHLHLSRWSAVLTKKRIGCWLRNHSNKQRNEENSLE